MSRLSVDGFKNFFRFWNNGIKQNEAIEALYAAMPVSLLEEDSTRTNLGEDLIKTKLGRDLIKSKLEEGGSAKITPWRSPLEIRLQL